ncbi:succinate dehydrogenase, cytochrome b556 subunit [Oceanicella actignis]|uniref:Succinate dehydrogenase cytochrome b556 subunit n=1 Tax=Oceanicella actignis TaxID=1189325 RepID=A0A1M7TAG1_9RHOB|nr:succinate dehydrogenase, cytochrome b556 subunit [Oceanicella actignis]SET52332.1 succinate dehydrogenase subunit C [Oceanicella actignis]SHN67701.1 succinate dehydrogenase subunit C [Oceanicella actignis]
MADVNRGNRPLSPHLQIYRPQLNSAMSIFHRITGVGMTLAAALIVWWLFAAASGPEAFAAADAVLTSWIGLLILFGSTWALVYHFGTGLRHLWMDMGYGYDIKLNDLVGQIILVASGVLTLLIWFLAL